MRIALYFASLLAFLAVSVVVRRRYRRWEIDGRSMVPALHPGDWVIVEGVTRGRRPVRPGDIVLARDPREPSRTLAKRVTRIEDGALVWLEGDNPAKSTDSRQFGLVADEGILGRVCWRYWPIGRMGRVR